MPQTVFRFHAELRDFLSPHMRGGEIIQQVAGRASIKDAIEALGVPHTEVEAIFVSDRAVDFTYIVADGDDINILPASVAAAHASTVRLRPPVPRPLRFVLDVHLGRLAAYLRLLGFDTLYRNDYTDDQLARIAAEEGRVLLTRDRGLLKRGIVTHGYWLRITRPRDQPVEVLRRFHVRDIEAALTRCMECNALLKRIDKQEIESRLPARTCEHHDEFHLCTGCERIYWRGTHYARLCEFVDALRRQLAA